MSAHRHNDHITSTIRVSHLSFPKSLDELRSLAAQLSQLKEDDFYGLLALFAAAYMYKQCFAIPGSVFMVNSNDIKEGGGGGGGNFA